MAAHPYPYLNFISRLAGRNEWNDEEKALELILALKGFADEILETMPASRRKNYNYLMVALTKTAPYGVKVPSAKG